jgi:hypothetical protein
MKGTRLTRSAPPEKPYLWRGSRRLIEVCEQLEAEREGRPAREVEPTFSFPQPLPGPAKPAGATNAEAQKRRRAAKRMAAGNDDEGMRSIA